MRCYSKLFVFSLMLIMLVFTSVSDVSANSVDSQMSKLTHYAEEYEIGNIDYIKLRLHMSSVRENMNNLLGSAGKEFGGIVKQDKLREVLGESNEETKWVWVEGEDHDAKLDYSVPVWRKIVFDGKKIQIKMEAHPSIFKKKDFYDDYEKQFIEFQGIEQGDIIYRLNFDVQFKRPEEQLDISGQINGVKTFAEIFNSDSTTGNAEALAKASVTAERIFQNYFEQSGGNCEDVMDSIFGSENKRESQQISLNEIVFCEGEKFEAILRLEMCDDCEWNWINMDLRFEGRGNFKQPENMGGGSRDTYRMMDESSLKTETARLIDEMQSSCQSENFESMMSLASKLRTVTEGWNEKANDVWAEMEKVMTDVDKAEGNEDPYYWIKQDQKARQRGKELRQTNYANRKSFYESLFSSYEKKEYFFSQTNYEKRLIQEFREKGEEICNNNIDDNENEQVDCDDSQCGGSVCGRGTTTIVEDNITKEIEVDYYCISGECKSKEEKADEEKGFCGNGICESNLNESIETCFEDCVGCPEYEEVECSGEVIFSGEDENGCNLEPICIEEKVYCNVNEDCVQPTCGFAECVRENEDEIGLCKITSLILCGEEECEEGEKVVEKCGDGSELVTAVCGDGMWVSLDVECTPGEESCDEHCFDYISAIMPSCPGDLEISGSFPNCKCDWVCEEKKEECETLNDCGGDKICSNGACIKIPDKKEVEPEKPENIPISEIEQESEEVEEPEQEEQKEVVEESQEEIPEEEPEEEQFELEPEPQEESQESGGEEITGNFIFAFFQSLVKRFRLSAKMTGYQVEEGESEPAPEPEQEPEPEEQGDEGDSAEPPSDDVPEDNGDDYEPGPGPEPDNDCADKWKACGGSCSPCDYEQGPEGGEDWEKGEWDEDERHGSDEEWEEKDREERERHEQENKERCQKECARPCVEECIRKECGDSMNCNIDSVSASCEGGCSADGNCIESCMSGDENWWKEFEQEHKEEKGVFQVGGGCRTEKGRTHGYVWFGGWGDPFDQVEPLKSKYYEGGQSDWCKYEVENLIRQRQEFEKGFNQEFAVWFFEKYLPNSAEEWEQSVSGIFELYWTNVDSQMRLAHTMQCLEERDINNLMNVNLIEIDYETSYGKIEYWEELKQVNVPGLDKSVVVVSPYMKVWVFPPKEFMIYEMQKSMENHEFPGSPEEKLNRNNEEGLTEKEKQEIINDRGLMNEIKKLSDKYGGNLDLVIQFKDYETDEIVFNLYAQVNENDLMKVEPMLPSENPAEDVRVELDFSIMHEMIQETEKEMMGARLESPPWDRKLQPVQAIKNVISGAKIYFKMNDLLGSARYYPEGAKNEIKNVFRFFFKTMMGGDEERGPEMKEEESEKDIEFTGESEGMSGKAVLVF